MPRERRDLIGTIIADKANWTNEEIIVWLDNEDKKEQDEYNKLESEFIRNDSRHTENRQKEIWARLTEEHARDSEQYILQNRIYNYYVTMSSSTSIAGKNAVQVDAKRDARSFRWGGRVVGSAGLTKPNYKPTMGGKRIGTRHQVNSDTLEHPSQHLCQRCLINHCISSPLVRC